MLEEPSLPSRTGRAAFNVPRKAIGASAHSHDTDDDDIDLIPPMPTTSLGTGRSRGAIKDRDIGGNAGLGLRGGRDIDIDGSTRSIGRAGTLNPSRGISRDLDIGSSSSSRGIGRGIGFGSNARSGTKSTAMSRNFGGGRGRGMDDHQTSSEGGGDDDFYLFHQLVSETSPVVHATWLSCVLFMLCVCLTILSAALYVIAKKDHPLPAGQDSNLELIVNTVPLDRYFVLMIFLSLMAVYWFCSWLILLCYRYNWKRGKLNGWVYDQVARHDNAGR